MLETGIMKTPNSNGREESVLTLKGLEDMEMDH